MNVTTSISTTSSSSDVSSTQSVSSSATKQTAEKSFDEEVKTASQANEKNENLEDTSVVKNEVETSKDKDLQSQSTDLNNSTEILFQDDDLIPSEMLSGVVNFTDFKYHNESQSLLSQNIQNLLNTRDLVNTINSAQSIDYDVVNMSDSDANFFANLVQNGNISMKDLSAQLTESANTQTIQSNVQVSSVLMEKLAESLKTNQPFRIDFDKDVSVIIKVNKDGSLMANFIPGDKAVEQYLRNNIAALRNRFDEENLSYSELTYSNSKNQQQQQKRKKENDNE